MITIEGSHGTSVTRAQRIQVSGFQLGTGRAGTGIYFWLGPYYIELAVGWYRFLASKNEFADDENPACAVIIVEVKAGEGEVLNLEDEELKNEIALVVKKQGINPHNKTAVAKLYDSFIMRLEEKLQVRFKAIKIRVGIPLEFIRDYPISVIGAPMCCVARDTGCITIKNMRIIEG
jgi:hypothetical protein